MRRARARFSSVFRRFFRFYPPRKRNGFRRRKKNAHRTHAHKARSRRGFKKRRHGYALFLQREHCQAATKRTAIYDAKTPSKHRANQAESNKKPVYKPVIGIFAVTFRAFLLRIRRSNRRRLRVLSKARTDRICHKISCRARSF